MDNRQNMDKKMKTFITLAAMALACICNAALVDTNGNPATNATELGEIDMKQSTVGDLNTYIAAGSLATNVVQDIVTNTVVVGYTSWTYSGDTTVGATYSITFEPSGGQYMFTLWDMSTSQNLGTILSSDINPLALSFSVTGGTIVASRSEIRRNANGLAMYSDVQALEEKVDTMDTSYYRVVGITNKNQSVQYVYTDASTTTLQVQMPESGMTKDWLVYVLASTNLTLVLPPANYWCASEEVTNDIPASTPTALYFSQINDDTYSIGRQELVPITIQTPLSLMMKSIHDKMKNRVRRIKK